MGGDLPRIEKFFGRTRNKKSSLKIQRFVSLDRFYDRSVETDMAYSIAIRTFVAFVTLLPTVSSAGGLRCSKPHRFTRQVRYWVEILPTPPMHSDVLRLEFGTGTDSGLLEVRYTDTVIADEKGNYRSSPSGPADLTFARGKVGRFDLKIRSLGQTVYQMRDFRCETTENTLPAY
jgi:hypothetical protein